MNSIRNININISSGNIVNNNQLYTYAYLSGLPKEVRPVNYRALPSLLTNCAIEGRRCNSIL